MRPRGDATTVRLLRRAAGPQPSPDAEPLDEDAFAAASPQPFIAAGDLERIGRRVVGVFACRVVRRGEAALPDRVRVVAHGSRRSAVAKDIQSAWFAGFGLYVPRRLFVVTPVRSRHDLLPERRRLQLCQLRVSSAGALASVTVALFCSGKVFEGAVVAAAGPDLVRVAADAAVDAVRGALGDLDGLGLADIRVIRIAGGPAMVAAVEAGGRTLLGVCAERGDRLEAAVRAVLDATNRLVAGGAAGRPAQPAWAAGAEGGGVPAGTSGGEPPGADR